MPFTRLEINTVVQSGANCKRKRVYTKDLKRSTVFLGRICSTQIVRNLTVE